MVPLGRIQQLEEAQKRQQQVSTTEAAVNNNVQQVETTVAADVTAPTVNNNVQLQLLNMAAAMLRNYIEEVDHEKQPAATSANATYQEQQNNYCRAASTISQGRSMVTNSDEEDEDVVEGKQFESQYTTLSDWV